MSAEELAEYLSKATGKEVLIEDVRRVFADGSMPERVTLWEFVGYLSGNVVS